MKVLMFGWEFPPHILGGLGTASYGLTKGMSQQDDLEITFCIPKPWGDEDQSFLRIIGMNSTPVVWKNVGWDYVKGRVGSYMDPQLFYDLRDHIYADFSYLNTNDLGCIEFSGRYPDNLHEEINNYSIVAGVVARQQEFDIIHSHDWLTYPAAANFIRPPAERIVICAKALSRSAEGLEGNRAAAEDGWHRLPIVLSAERIGEIVNLNRVSVARQLSRWMKLGLVKREGRTLLFSEKLFGAVDDWIENRAPAETLSGLG